MPRHELYTAADILPYLDNVKQKNGNQWQANCPLCGDTKQHLYIKYANEKLMMYCQHCNAKFTEVITELEYRGLKRREKEQIDYQTTKPVEDYYHIYRLPDGKEAFRKRRLKWADGKKAFPFQHQKDGKTTKGQPTNANKLYNLDKLYQADADTTLYIVEGEKCADALTKSGLLATTTSTGSQKHINFTNTDKKVLQKFSDIVLIPDNDEKGSDYVEAFKDYDFKILDLKKVWEHCPHKGDIADYLQQGGDIEAIKNYQFPPKLTADYINSLSIEQLMSFELLEQIHSQQPDKANMLLAMATTRAAALKCKKSFEKQIRLFKQSNSDQGSKTKFINQPFSLQCGEWTANEGGVYKRIQTASGGVRTEYASYIPIMPAERLENRETNKTSITLLYGNTLNKRRTVEKSVISNSRLIVGLSDYGVDVTSESAKHLVNYLNTVINLNGDIIPRLESVSRLGWQGQDFIPYDGNAVLDNADEAAELVAAVSQQSGTLQEWADYIRPLRENNLYFRLVIAASFASVLIEKVNALPFILHLWGGTGTGKTVALMAAASVWGNPKQGKLLLTLNMTPNALMQTAAMLYSLPLIGDELQTIKNEYNTGYDKIVMQLTEGTNRGRLDSNAKIKQPRAWKNAFITNGEEPITQATSGGGVKNRVIELECHEKLIPNGNETVNFIRSHYGVAGRSFIEHIKTKQLDKMQQDFSDTFSALLQLTDTSEKQALAMALIAIADCYANECIFHSEPLQLQRLAEMLKTLDEIDESKRAFAAIVDIIAANGDKFDKEMDSNVLYSVYWGRRYSDGTVKIIKTILEQELKKLNTSFEAVKKKWADNGYLSKNTQGRYFSGGRLNGNYCHYATLKTKE